MNMSEQSPILHQARSVLTSRYGFTEATMQDLTMMVSATDDPATSAVSVRSQCTFVEQDAADCLLLLEVCALELQRMQRLTSGGSHE